MRGGRSPDPWPESGTLRVLERLLAPCLPPGVVGRSILGDLREEYLKDLAVMGRIRARARHLKRALSVTARFMAPGSRRPAWKPGQKATSGGIMSTLVTDLRNAFRSLKKSPGFTVVVILTLALGIGANVAMFSIVDAVLLKSLPFPEPDRLILGRTTYEGQLAWNASSEDYYDYRDRVDAFESLAVIRTFDEEVTVTGGDQPERVASTMVSPNLFPTLRVTPEVGRGFLPEDGDLSTANVAVISHGYWQRHFGGDAAAVGSVIAVNGAPATVVGIMPANFFFFQNVDIWLPMKVGGPWTGVRRFHNWTVVGRLAPGVSIQQAQSQVDVVAAQLQEAYPDSNAEKGMAVLPLKDVLVDQYDEMLFTLMAAIGLVLLIACGNVAGLLLARGLGRTRELSVRAALGASRGRLVRQLLGESLILGVGAGIVGTFLAYWLQGVALGVLPLDYVGITELGLSGSMLGFALALSLVTALIFGAIPAWTGARTNPGENLASGSRTTEAGKGAKIRSGLVVVQVALSLVLLIGSGLLVRSFVRLQGVDPGFEPAGLLTAHVSIPAARYDPVERVAFYDGLLRDIREIQEVRAAAAISQLPIKDGYSNVGAWDPENPPAGPRDQTLAEHRRVTPGYFDAMEIPILAGRDFLDLSTPESEFALIINQTMARGLFGDQNPVGRQVAVDAGEDQPLLARVVGMVGDVRMTGLAREPQWQMYYSLGQAPSTEMSLAIRTAGNPANVVNAVREVLRARDPDIPLGSVETMDDVFWDAVATPRILMSSLSAFALVALFLSVLGLYSVLAFFVVRRMHEIGIRVAMGASGGKVMGLILRRGLVLVLGGLVLGLGGAFFLTRYLQEQLFQTQTTDPLTFGGVSLGLLLVAVLACLLPAWRALKVDPVRALQVE